MKIVNFRKLEILRSQFSINFNDEFKKPFFAENWVKLDLLIFNNFVMKKSRDFDYKNFISGPINFST